ncbi:MAG: pilus assembly protein TadG-related protein [Chloroflexota bacterium]|nr:pilus assembly protein TadG-related protein [Chloroflexota bacterium]
MARSRSESGQSLIWTTMLLAFVVVPLLVLVVDGIQLWRVRNQLQTATDAACEEAAWVAADRQAFRDSGVTRFYNQAQAVSEGTSTFQQVLSNTGTLQYSPGIAIGFDASVPSSQCTSTAFVSLLVSATIPDVTVTVESQSEIHFSR